MINPALYKKTVDILFQAYFNDTLEHGNCCACAVGNLVAANMGIELIKHPNGGEIIWKDHAYPAETNGWGGMVNNTGSLREISDNGLAQIKSTGYTENELSLIEAAFEGVNYCNDESDDEHMFNGLVAVLEVLKDIHQVEDNAPEVVRFRDQYTNRTCKAL